MTSKPVYSTAGGDQRQPSKTAPSYKAAKGPCKVRLETKGRGGKTVTVLFNLPFADKDAATAVMKDLQTAFGCGATFKDNTIELRGDLRDRLDQYFKQKGWQIIRAGG